MALLVAQRERARYQALEAEHDAGRYSDELDQDLLLQKRVLSLALQRMEHMITATSRQARRVRRQTFVRGSVAVFSQPLSSLLRRLEKEAEMLRRYVADLHSLLTIHSPQAFFSM